MTQDSVKSLHEAFPELDAEVINEVVATSGGGTVGPNVINILLGMSDPSYKPEEQDVSRAKELERDAEYARRLAASEMPRPSGHNRMRQYSAPPPPQQQQQQPQGQQSGGKTGSKIRNMLRIGRRSTSTSMGSNSNTHAPPSIPRDPPMEAMRRTALDSDFSDTPHSSASSLSPIAATSRSNNNNDDNSTQAPAAAREEGENIFDDSSSINQKHLLSSYVPLSPSKYKAPAKQQQQQQQQAVAATEEDSIDLEHPFDSNPLLLPSSADASATHDNNPFTAIHSPSPPPRRRRLTDSEDRDHHIGGPSSISDTNPFHNLL
ncbi:hypothetical protein GGI23_001844 [Coemansia sp. RSA 2559]|nr:hypothetical protein GGI23_001844 [Coemansia sp. RSA 2559]